VRDLFDDHELMFWILARHAWRRGNTFRRFLGDAEYVPGPDGGWMRLGRPPVVGSVDG
jgi:hypothetical protein